MTEKRKAGKTRGFYLKGIAILYKVIREGLLSLGILGLS